MKLIAKELKEVVEAHDFGYPVTVVRNFNAKIDVFPRVVVYEIDNTPYYTDSRGELTSEMLFQLDIYTQDQVIGGEVINRIDMADDLTLQVDAVIAERYGMNRDYTGNANSYGNDTIRKILRYSCAIDQFDYTYRGH